jgi:sulfite reductase (ferredoxin)
MSGEKLSKVEGIKRASRELRGGILASLAESAPYFGDDDKQLLKFHGLYEGYDRDSATALKQQGLEKRWEFMLRVKAPAGRMTSAQYLALDDVATRYAGGKLRITTRQTIQLHGVAKSDLAATMRGISESLLTTFGACGDVVRNVTATPAPIADARHRLLAAEADRISAAFFPRTRAYHQIWMLGEEAAPEPDEADPLYGPTYLPRKFKIGLAEPEDNWVDVLTNDLALLALFEGDRLVGWNLAIGGGLGMTHNKAHTYPRLASFVGFIEPESVIETIAAVIALQRDHGDRADRRHARLKYVVDAKGLPWIKADLAQRLGRPLEDPRPMPAFTVRDHMGWHPQGDGNWYFGLSVPSGRIEDRPGWELATALRRLTREVPLRPVFSPTQDVLFADVAPEDRARVDAVLAEHGIGNATTPLRRWALACPALPSCGLALTEAERVLDRLIAQVEGALEAHSLGDERLSLRVTGCPNGCARPYVGDIGLVGRMPGFYAIFLGGDFEGTRLNEKIFERVAETSIGSTLEPIFGAFAASRFAGESFGAWCHRVGAEALRALAGTEAAAAE